MDAEPLSPALSESIKELQGIQSIMMEDMEIDNLAYSCNKYSMVEGVEVFPSKLYNYVGMEDVGNCHMAIAGCLLTEV